MATGGAVDAGSLLVDAPDSASRLACVRDGGAAIEPVGQAVSGVAVAGRECLVLNAGDAGDDWASQPEADDGGGGVVQGAREQQRGRERERIVSLEILVDQLRASADSAAERAARAVAERDALQEQGLQMRIQHAVELSSSAGKVEAACCGAERLLAVMEAVSLAVGAARVTWEAQRRQGEACARQTRESVSRACVGICGGVVGAISLSLKVAESLQGLEEDSALVQELRAEVAALEASKQAADLKVVSQRRKAAQVGWR